MNPHRYGKRLPGMLLCLLAGGAQAHTVLVHVMAQESIAPKWIANARRADGICPDMMAAMERAEPRLRFAVHVQGRSLPAIEAGLASGEVDAACALIDSPRRRAVAEPVGPPLYAIRHRLAGRMDDDAVVRSLDDLVRLKALVDTTTGSAFVARMKAAGVPVDDSTGDNLLNLRKVLAGHGRFAYMNELALKRYVRTHGWERRIRVLPLVEEEPAWFWVSRKAPPEVARLIGKALARIRASGELGRIYAAWTHAPEAAHRVAARGAH
jgi:glutamate/aspartate transport system substrate-binding protein